eukprot:7091536-Karenia_brevis.AAC.1
MSMLDLPAEGLNVKSSARDVTQERLAKVTRFLRNPMAAQALRRASLVLQLTSRVEDFMSAYLK